MRSLSSFALQAMYAQETGSIPFVLIRGSHPVLGTGFFNFTSDTVETVSNGITYQPFPFEITLPDDDPDQVPSCSLTLDNIDRSMVAAVRGMGNVPATIELQVAMSDTPDVVEMAVGPLTLRDVNYDALTVMGTLRFEEILNEPYPGDIVTPATLPGVFLLA